LTRQSLSVPFPKSSSPSPKPALVVRQYRTHVLTLYEHQSQLAFDPKPFIQTFEAAVDKLLAVRKDVQAKTEQLEKSVRIAEREYSKKMADLNRGFEVCNTWIPLCALIHLSLSL
jgi:hypothetical protein